jgi:hypothetical protein
MTATVAIQTNDRTKIPSEIGWKDHRLRPTQTLDNKYNFAVRPTHSPCWNYPFHSYTYDPSNTRNCGQ